MPLGVKQTAFYFLFRFVTCFHLFYVSINQMQSWQTYEAIGHIHETHIVYLPIIIM